MRRATEEQDRRKRCGMDAQRVAGRSAGAYEEVDPYTMMVQQVEQLNRATKALSALHVQLLD